MNKQNFIKYNNIEVYLATEVNQHFHENGFLSSFDFFCIVTWKAKRAKSVVAKKLLSKGARDLDEAVKDLTEALHNHSNAEARLKYLLYVWRFRLPLATSILSVLYPEEFVVYDFQICDMLGAFHELYHKTKFDNIWKEYQKFVQTLVENTSQDLILQDKCKYLWGKSFYKQLKHDIEISNFSANEVLRPIRKIK